MRHDDVSACRRIALVACRRIASAYLIKNTADASLCLSTHPFRLLRHKHCRRINLAAYQCTALVAH